MNRFFSLLLWIFFKDTIESIRTKSQRLTSLIRETFDEIRVITNDVALPTTIVDNSLQFRNNILHTPSLQQCYSYYQQLIGLYERISAILGTDIASFVLVCSFDVSIFVSFVLASMPPPQPIPQQQQPQQQQPPQQRPGCNINLIFFYFFFVHC